MVLLYIVSAVAYMDREEGKRWRTQGHKTHVEYQKVIADLVLESTLVRAS
jgi:catechol O-methyltransferase